MLMVGRGGPQVWTRRQRASATWEPDDLTGIDVWLRADDLDAALADADPVASWVDRIAAKNFAQATAAKKPTFYVSTAAHLINGQPCVYLDGVDDLLRYATALVGLSGHVIVVGQYVSLPAATSAEVILSSADEATSVRLVHARTRAPILDSGLSIAQRDNDTVDAVDATTTVLAAGTDYALEWASSGTDYSMRVNGTVQAESVQSGADTGDWFSDVTGADNTVVGAVKDSAERLFSDIDVAEVIVVKDATLTAGERTDLNSYISSRYSITMA